MDIMDGMDTMDFSFDGRNGQVQGRHLLYVSILSIKTCPFMSMMSIASIVSLSIKSEPFPDVVKRMETH